MFRFNGGIGAITCDKCSTIIAESVAYTKRNMQYIYCQKCKEEQVPGILIRKVKDEYGWLGNMSPHPVEHKGSFRTTEALFQSLRFDDEAVIEAIRAEKSPMGAKFVSKKHKDKMWVAPMSSQDITHMRLCLKLKVAQHPKLLEALLETAEDIAEDCTKRLNVSGLFWGMALIDRKWKGQNWLGRLWMEIRRDA